MVSQEVEPDKTTYITTGTLKECQAAAMLFQNTCPNYTTDEILPVEEMDYEDGDCTQQPREVKLCVTCRVDLRGFTLIRV